MIRLRNIIYLILLIFIFPFLILCAEVPITHRKSLQLLPQSQILALSLNQYSQIIKKSKLCEDPQKVAMVKRVGMRIAKATEEFLKEEFPKLNMKFEWEFNLIEDDKVINAWALPGGKVAVYTGILPIAKDDNGLAVVLGHEIAHVIANHGNERMSQALITTMGGLTLSVALSKKSKKTRDIFLAAYGIGATVGFMLPYSRLQENEADRIGLILMAKAGYDPREALNFWLRMKKRGEKGKKIPEFLSTHPATESRIQNIKRLIPEALPYYLKARKG